MITSVLGKITRINRMDLFNKTTQTFGANREGIKALELLIEKYKSPIANFGLYFKGITLAPDGMYFWCGCDQGFLVRYSKDNVASVTVLNNKAECLMAMENQIVNHNEFIVPTNLRTNNWD
jgi:hypothetical protein